MKSTAIRRWSWIHKWSSLVCTAFMLLLCLTGLPLIFHDEIGHLLGSQVEAPDMPAGTPHADLDSVLAATKALYPAKVPQYFSREADDDRLWFVTLGDTPIDSSNEKSITVDARSAKVLADTRFDEGFMWMMYRLHVDLYAGLAGKLFLGFMGLLLVVAIVSGVVLYAPFMRRLDFGTVRRERSPRIKWLDLHNLLGIVTLVWALVVGSTGVINTWADLLVKQWQNDHLGALLAPYRDQPMPEHFASLHAAVKKAEAHEKDRTVAFVAFPGTAFSSPHHYAVFMRGNTPLTARLVKPVLVDVSSGQMTASVDLPWYLSALLVSQPLHFGDYGGLPLKILWALLDIVTIVVLGSGLYLWLKRRQPRDVVGEAQATLLAPEGGTR